MGEPARMGSVRKGWETKTPLAHRETRGAQVQSGDRQKRGGGLIGAEQAGQDLQGLGRKRNPGQNKGPFLLGWNRQNQGEAEGVQRGRSLSLTVPA